VAVPGVKPPGIAALAPDRGHRLAVATKNRSATKQNSIRHRLT
jgi:hypothetical protein